MKKVLFFHARAFMMLLLTLLAGTVAWAQTTHVVTNANVDEIFSGTGYTLGDGVSAGDVLDFRGTIDKDHSLVINKQVNIISSTKNAVIQLHSKTVSIMDNNFPANSFIVNVGGSGSKISDLRFENTQTWLHHVQNLSLTNMVMCVKNERVGSGVGHVSVRYCNHVTFDHCYVYTENNGGSTCFVLIGTSNSTIKNTTIEGQGNVGNLLYFNVFNDGDKPDGFVVENNDNTVKDCTFIGKLGSAISVGLMVGDKRNLIEGNTFNKCSISTAFGSKALPNAIADANIYRNNTITDGGSLTANQYSIVEKNTVSGALTTGQNSIAKNNTIGGNLTASISSTANDNTVGGTLTVAQGAQVTNNTAKTATVSGKDAVVKNNTIKGNVTINNSASNTTFTNNNVTGTVTVNSNGNTITGNTVVSTGEYAVDLKTKSNNDVQYNRLTSNGKDGDAAVKYSSGQSNTVQNNTHALYATLEGSVANATVKFYVSDAEPTAAPTGEVTTEVKAGQWVILEVTPDEGYWTYDEMLTLQMAGSIGGAEAPMRRAIQLPVHPIALSGNLTDGKGYYYYQVPAECTAINGYKSIIVGGDMLKKVDLSTATKSTDGKTITATTDGWTATIVLDQVSWTYNAAAHGPQISSFSLTNGVKTFTNTNDQVVISGNSQTNAGDYHATLSPKDEHSCLTKSFDAPFAIAQLAVDVTIKGHKNTAPYDGYEHSVESYDVEISNALYQESYFNFTGTASAKRTDAGKTDMNLADSQFTNKNANFNVTFDVIDGSQTVQKVDLKLIAEDKSRQYGEADPLFTFKGEGFVNGETSAVLSKQPTLSTKATVTSIAGKYAISISDAEAANYNISYQNGVLTIEESPDDHSGIRVIRNDTKELVHNVAILKEVMVGESKTLRIDKVTIDAPQDASATNPVSVSVYIPATLEEYEGTKLPIYGVGADIIATEDYVPVTDIYLPNTEKMINVAVQAFRLDAQERVTARIHTSLPLLDDYALTPGLKKEYEDSHVMTTVTRNTKYWTLSCGVDLICPEAATAYTCQPDGNSAVAAVAITSNTVMVGNDERVVIKANNGVLMGNDDEEGGDYDLVASPSSDRPNGTPPTTDDAKTYEGNLMVPALIETHFEPSQYYILYHDLFHELQEDDNTSVSPCKAVLRKGYGSMLSRLRIELDEEPTGIETTDNGQQTTESWYTINGVKLDEQPTEKGVYIHNGKKVVIK